MNFLHKLHASKVPDHRKSKQLHTPFYVILKLRILRISVSISHYNALYLYDPIHTTWLKEHFGFQPLIFEQFITNIMINCSLNPWAVGLLLQILVDHCKAEAARGSWLAVVPGVQSTDSGGLYVMCNR